METNHNFELHRQSDNLIYYFAEHGRDENGIVFKRRDAGVLILKHPKFGWVAVSDGEVTGVPWLCAVQDQGTHPPDGDWISRKGLKTYIYSLVYAPS